MKPRMILVALVTLVCAAAVAVAGTTGARSDETDRHPSYEVWLIDQEDRFNSGGGTLHIFDDQDLETNPNNAEAESFDLGTTVGAFCQERTGTVPNRPHMLVFEGGDSDDWRDNLRAIIAYVGSGHVAVVNAAGRIEPIACIDVGTQAHAAWPTPDERHLIVANQNGKLLQRIRTDHATNDYVLEDAATINLATCNTPSGAACQDPTLRPDNAPICPRTTSDGRFTFVTLRGGGMFVVDHNTTPMRIVAEYDRAHVDDNGCGEMEIAGKMYVNSGAGTTVPPVPGDESFGHDVYSFELAQFSTTPAPPNTPAARHVYTRDPGEVDAHAVERTSGGYLWWGDRVQNDVTVVDPGHDRVVGRFGLAGAFSSDPAPDLFDSSPDGTFVFASLRGPNPATGHDAVGNTPGVGVISVNSGGRTGTLLGVSRVGSVHGTPDPHAIRVRALR
jgi:hypothetical protein